MIGVVLGQATLELLSRHGSQKTVYSGGGRRLKSRSVQKKQNGRLNGFEIDAIWIDEA